MYTRSMYIVRVSYMGAGALGLQPDGGAPRDGRSRDDGISAPPHPHTHIPTPLPVSHLPCSLSTPPPSPVAPAVLGAPYISHREGRPYRLLAARQVIHPAMLIILPLKFFLKHTDPLADT